MSRIIKAPLVGIEGDVLINRRFHQRYFPDIPSEDVDNHFVRLLGLPRIRQVDSREPPMLMITFDRELIIVNNQYPQGFHLQLDIPPIKMIFPTRPLSLLDVSNTLLFIDINKLIAEQSNGIIPSASRYRWTIRDNQGNHVPRDIKLPEIEGVRRVSVGEEIGKKKSLSGYAHLT